MSVQFFDPIPDNYIDHMAQVVLTLPPSKTLEPLSESLKRYELRGHLDLDPGATFTASSRRLSLRGLSEGTYPITYMVIHKQSSVVFENDYEEFDAEVIFNIVVLPIAPVISKPYSVRLRDIKDNSITLEWRVFLKYMLHGDESNLDYNKFEVAYKQKTGKDWLHTIVPIKSKLEHTFSDLARGVAYQFRIRTIDFLKGAHSDWVEVEGKTTGTKTISKTFKGTQTAGGETSLDVHTDFISYFDGIGRETATEILSSINWATSELDLFDLILNFYWQKAQTSILQLKRPIKDFYIEGLSYFFENDDWSLSLLRFDERGNLGISRYDQTPNFGGGSWSSLNSSNGDAWETDATRRFTVTQDQFDAWHVGTAIMGIYLFFTTKDGLKRPNTIDFDGNINRTQKLHFKADWLTPVIPKPSTGGGSPNALSANSSKNIFFDPNIPSVFLKEALGVQLSFTISSSERAANPRMLLEVHTENVPVGYAIYNKLRPTASDSPLYSQSATTGPLSFIFAVPTNNWTVELFTPNNQEGGWVSIKRTPTNDAAQPSQVTNINQRLLLLRGIPTVRLGWDKPTGVAPTGYDIRYKFLYERSYKTRRVTTEYWYLEYLASNLSIYQMSIRAVAGSAHGAWSDEFFANKNKLENFTSSLIDPVKERGKPYHLDPLLELPDGYTFNFPSPQFHHNFIDGYYQQVRAYEEAGQGTTSIILRNQLQGNVDHLVEVGDVIRISNEQYRIIEVKHGPYTPIEIHRPLDHTLRKDSNVELEARSRPLGSGQHEVKIFLQIDYRYDDAGVLGLDLPITYKKKAIHENWPSYGERTLLEVNDNRKKVTYTYSEIRKNGTDGAIQGEFYAELQPVTTLNGTLIGAETIRKRTGSSRKIVNADYPLSEAYPYLSSPYYISLAATSTNFTFLEDSNTDGVATWNLKATWEPWEPSDFNGEILFYRLSFHMEQHSFFLRHIDPVSVDHPADQPPEVEVTIQDHAFRSGSSWLTKEKNVGYENNEVKAYVEIVVHGLDGDKMTTSLPLSSQTLSIPYTFGD